METPVALITGLAGQDGSLLAGWLLHTKGYEVWGLVRHSSQMPAKNLEDLKGHEDLHVRYGDVTDMASVMGIVAEIAARKPKRLEVYNLAAQSHVQVSFASPAYTFNVNVIGFVNVLEALRASDLYASGVDVRVCQASTSEMFGSTPPPQCETSGFHPRSPYAVSKLAAYWAARNYREAYGMHVSNSICFNHESEHRGTLFVTRKISLGVARIAANIDRRPIELGNLDAARDWGYAPDYVRAMWLIVQQSEPDDYVVATGESHTVREFATQAFKTVGVPFEWHGEGMNEEAIRTDTGDAVVKLDLQNLRAAEVNSLRGDASKLRAATGWEPHVSFGALVDKMVNNDLNNIG